MNNQARSEIESIFSTLGLALSFLTAVSPIFINSKITNYFVNHQLVVPSSFAALIFGVLIAWLCINFFPFIALPIRGRKSNNPKMILQRHMVLFTIPIAFAAFIVFFAVHVSLLQSAAYIVFFDSLIAGFSLLISNVRGTADNRQEVESLPFKTVSLLEKNGVVSTNIKIEINSPIGEDILQVLNIQHYGGARYVRVSEGSNVKDTIISYDARELLYVLGSDDHEALKKNGINIGQI